MIDQIRPPRDPRESVIALQERGRRRRQQTVEDLPGNLSIWCPGTVLRQVTRAVTHNTRHLPKPITDATPT